jgi:hypothetical protein
MKLLQLTFEAQQVIWLRTMRLSLGGAAAELEASRMVWEKLAAAAAASRALAAGASPEKLVGGYRRRVRANIKRLSQPPRKRRSR